MLGILRDFAGEFPDAQPELHATSFVIVSPQARSALDRSCLIGQGWWNDDWWVDADASGLMGIGNHSWDHLHPSLPTVAQREQRRGDFSSIDTSEDARVQILRSSEFLRSRTGGESARLFAYPYGQYSPYLVDEYLPGQAKSPSSTLAAFTTAGSLWDQDSNRWQLPRWVCGDHWKSPHDLESLLNRIG